VASLRCRCSQAGVEGGAPSQVTWVGLKRARFDAKTRVGKHPRPPSGGRERGSRRVAYPPEPYGVSTEV